MPTLNRAPNERELQKKRLICTSIIRGATHTGRLPSCFHYKFSLVAHFSAFFRSSRT